MWIANRKKLITIIYAYFYFNVHDIYMYFYFDVQGCRIEALMKEKIYDMVLKDKINPEKNFTFDNVKLLNNAGQQTW